MSMTSLVALKRGAMTASWIPMPKSSTLSKTCRIAIGIHAQPGAPSVATARSPENTIVGDMDENRRFPDAIDPDLPGRGSYQFIAPLSMKPVQGGMTPEGKPSVCVRVTIMPAWSTHETVVV